MKKKSNTPRSRIRSCIRNLPKTVIISGKTYSVKSNSKNWGGTADNSSQIITVGTKGDQSEQRIFDNLIHEVVESVIVERNLSFVSSDNELKIVMNHKEFDQVAVDISTALWHIINKENQK